MATSLVNLLSYSETICELLGSRWRFNVNMGFSNEDRILIKKLYVFKGYGAIILTKEFPDRGWNTMGTFGKVVRNLYVILFFFCTESV